MKTFIPKKIAIDHDDYYANRVGRTPDGRQFFVTSPFEPAIGQGAGREYLATYVFDAAGQLISSKIDDLGPRSAFDESHVVALRETRIAELGEITFCRIEIAPFSIEFGGTVFGLVVREPDDDDDPLVVEAQPGNYMAFFEPWDSGIYDTWWNRGAKREIGVVKLFEAGCCPTARRCSSSGCARRCANFLGPRRPQQRHACGRQSLPASLQLKCLLPAHPSAAPAG